MERRSKLRGLVQFGVFQADLNSGELFKSGLRIRLPEQPFRMLAILLESPGEVVSRDELRQRLWPESTHVDFDRGLNTAASKLRDALGDASGNSRYIETLPRRDTSLPSVLHFDRSNPHGLVPCPADRTGAVRASLGRCHRMSSGPSLCRPWNDNRRAAARG
jgi:hypothetical protein